MKSLLSLTFILYMSISYGQNASVKGKVLDTEDLALIGANVVLLDADKVIKYQAATDVQGLYALSNVAPGKYVLKISYVGYFSVFKDLEVGSADIEYETMRLYESPVEMDEVVVEGRVPLAQQNGDTTSYNASQYKVLADASTEDLVVKMPGVVIENGTIQAEGENVQQVLVDGKPFFGNDASAALKNLPAEVVSKIEIFDQKSEQAEFTGFDDGETTKTINIVTKIDKRNGQFGKAYAAYGSEGHYNLGGNFSLFNGDQRISFIGQANDINIQNFSSEDILGISGSNGRRFRGGGGGRGGGTSNFSRGGNQFQVAQQAGISKTEALGINFSDQWGEETEVSLSYFANRSRNLSEEYLDRQFFDSEEAGSQERYFESNLSKAVNLNHRFNARIDHKFTKNTSLNFRPSISYQGNNGEISTEGSTALENLTLNETDNLYQAANRGWNINNRALLRHRIGKSRRTISLSLRSTYTSKKGDSDLLSVNDYFRPIMQSDVLDQIADLQQDGWNNSANLKFTNPLGKKSMLGLEYRITLDSDDSGTETFSKNETGAYSQLEEALSNAFKNDYLTHSGGLSLNYRLGKSMIVARASLQHASLVTEQEFPFEASFDRSYLNVMPFAMWRYNIDRQNNLRVIYRTNTRRPSLLQLQEVVDNSNPIQLSIGNNALDQQYQHSIFARLKRTNTEKGTVLFALIGGNVTQNYIGNSLYTSRSDNSIVDEINLLPGSQLNQTVNLRGYWDFRTFLTYGMPIYLIKSNLNLNLSANFSNTPGLIDDVLNNAQSSTYGLGLSLSSNISEKIDFLIGSKTSFNTIANDINTFQNTEYLNQRTSLKLNWILAADFVFRTDINNQLYTGLSDGFNENYWIWNLAVGKKIFKNKLGEINISVYDLLNQNLRITREVTGNYVEDVRTNVLQQYVMVNFIYNFRNFKTSKEATERENNQRDEWRGGRF